MVEVTGLAEEGPVVVVSSSGEAVMVVTPASPQVVRRRSASKVGLGQRLRDSMLSPGLRRRESLAILKQPVVSLLVAGRRITRSRSVSKVGQPAGSHKAFVELAELVQSKASSH